MALRWKSDLELGIFELDLKKEELFTRFEEFTETIDKESGPDEIGDFLGYLESYAKHFEFEEHLQDKSNFPERKDHAAAHLQFIQDLDMFRGRLRDGEDAKEITIAVKGMMIRWLIKHSSSLDKEFRNFLLARSEKSKMDLVREKLGDILVESGLINQDTLAQALESQKQSGKLLGAVLIDMGAIKLQEVINAQAIQNGMLARDCLK